LSVKKRFLKEEILNTAYEIIRKGGEEALNMRTLAETCKCSTQPIYHAFSGAEELKSELRELAGNGARKELDVYYTTFFL